MFMLFLRSTILIIAPLVGVWIEIFVITSYLLYMLVAPLVGVWIEICQFLNEDSERKITSLVGL
ncbi:hypothetical protein JG486_29915 (plasmid) [Bacillus mycoides]|uniref:hypothetical protein n=1 Tax=Bacillus cereus group TaxID=86661 RepID=UPI0011C90028|nr:hypothetical protein [Bacillus sp. AR13-1]QWI78295.1 hypothetical protein JG486_29915 [Bacillus mycoides]TXR81499.1 hypothetical protein DN408_13115 [Bacillus sp. AR13-1]